MPKETARKMTKIVTKAKIRTLRLVSRVTRACIIKMLMFITTTRYDLAAKKISRRNIKNSPRYSQKTSKIIDFLYTTYPIMVTLQAPRVDKLSKIDSKVVREDFVTLSKNHIDCICRFFTIREVPSPDAE